MKNRFFSLAPVAVLLVIFLLSLWNGRTIESHTDRWRAQLCQAAALSQENRWPEASQALEDTYEDWSQRQMYLHIISEHQFVDDAEAMFRRAMAFSATRVPSEFQAEVADLRDQLGMMAKKEQLSLKNIL